MSRLGYYILCGLLCSSAWVVYGGDGTVSSNSPTNEAQTPSSPVKADAVMPEAGPTLDIEQATDSMKDSIKPKILVIHTSDKETLSAAKPTEIPESTTPIPIPTTPTPTTPTPKPTPPGPLPPPDQGTWWYTDDQNITCIVIQFAAQLNVTYTKSVENKTSLAFTLLNVPLNATADGSCAAKDGRQWITLQWPVAENATATNKMAFFFVRNDTTKNYMIESLNVSLATTQFVNASSNATIEVSHPSLWLTPLATSYRCAVPTRLNMTAAAGSSVQAAVLTVARLQEEAFRTKNGKGFSAARECGGGDVPDAVPIAVGCALGGLVVVVLIAYLVGRRRSAARGYLSM